MTKTLQQIKDDVAKEYMEHDFNSCYNRDNVSESMIDQISIRYAQQQNKELLEMLEQCELWIGNCNQYAPILKVIDKILKQATEI